MIKVITAFAEDIPDWVRDNLNPLCPYCGSYTILEKCDGRYTQHYCLNPKCYGHMSYKLVDAAKMLNISGIGPATALSIVKQCSNHVESLCKILGYKPEVELWEAAQIINIYGHRDDWKDLCRGKKNFTEVLQSVECPTDIREQATYILECEQYFSIKRPMSSNIIYVMITGSLSGYSNREDFLKYLNEKYGQYVCFYSCGKSSKAQFLIKEAHTVDHSKSAYARQHNIPIVTPVEMEALIQKFLYKFI